MEKKNESNKKVVTMKKDYKEFAKNIFQRYAIMIIFLVMVIALSILSPAFLQPRNLLNVVRQISVIGLVAIGVTMVIITGGTDLSSGSIIAVAAVVAASLAQRSDWAAAMYPSLTGLPVIVPIMAGLIVGTIAGLINGVVVAKTRIPPFIATLGMMTAARGLALLYSDGRPISSLTNAYNFIGQGEILGIPFPIIIFLTMAIFTHIILNNTKFGRHVYAVGGNKQAALVSGINVSKYLTLVYTYAGFLAGMAGIVLSARISSGQPGLGVGYELDAIAAAVIGGTSFSEGGVGTIPGTIAGALIIGVLNNGLDLLNVSAYWQQIIKGIIIVGAVILDERKNRS